MKKKRVKCSCNSVGVFFNQGSRQYEEMIINQTNKFNIMYTQKRFSSGIVQNIYQTAHNLISSHNYTKEKTERNMIRKREDTRLCNKKEKWKVY